MNKLSDTAKLAVSSCNEIQFALFNKQKGEMAMDLEDIYRENYPIVYGYLLSLCADPQEAEELTAQAFFKAIQNIKRYDKTCKPSTWLCTIGRNLYFNECKRKKRHAPLEEDKIPAADDPQQMYIEKETARKIYQYAVALESPYREVFFLRLEGLSFREIGAAMEKTENWARVTYFRAKTKIREETEDDHG